MAIGDQRPDFRDQNTSGAAIQVTRDKTRSQDQAKAYMILVDGEKVGDLPRGKTVTIPVTPGDHVVWVSVSFEQSRQLSVSLVDGDVIHLMCRSRPKQLVNAHVDLYLADPTDRRIHVRASGEDQPQDMAVKHRAVTRDGQILAVWAHKSGYLRSLDPGANSSDGEGFLVEMAIYIVALPVLFVLRWVRHRLVFKRGWSVGVVRDRNFLWPEKVRLERFPDEVRARERAAEVWSDIGTWDRV